MAPVDTICTRVAARVTVTVTVAAAAVTAVTVGRSRGKSADETPEHLQPAEFAAYRRRARTDDNEGVRLRRAEVDLAARDAADVNVGSVKTQRWV